MTLKQRDYQWQNWVGTQKSVADLYEPVDLVDLKNDVKTASAKPPVRALGGGFSWSALVNADGGSLISTAKLDRVLQIDRAGGTLAVEAGITIKELAQVALDNGLALHSPPIFDGMTLGGVLAVGGHGTGQGLGTMSDSIDELTIVTPDGTERTLRNTDPELESAATGLGLLGIIYSVKLRCEPAYNVQIEKGYVSNQCLVTHLDDLLESYEFVDLYWYLSGDRVWVRLGNRTSAPADPPNLHSISEVARDQLIQLAGGAVLPPLVSRFPDLTQRLIRFIFDKVIDPPANNLDFLPQSLTAVDRHRFFERQWTRFSNAVGRAVRTVVEPRAIEVVDSRRAAHYIDGIFESLTSEFAVETDKAADIWRSTVEFVRDETAPGARYAYAVNLTVHARFVNASALPLNPATGRKTCYIEVVTIVGTRHAQPFLNAFHDFMMKRPGNARPHWGKVFKDNDPSLDEIRLRYDDRSSQQFSSHRRSIDPSNALVNKLLETLKK